MRRFNAILITLGSVFAAVAGLTLSPQPALAGSYGGSYGQVGWQWFDTCTPPTTTQMQTWWNNSPFWGAGLYYGGANSACARNTPLTTTYLSTINAQGWDLIPIWVGLQAPCVSPNNGYATFSTNSTTAFSQGGTDGNNMANAAAALQISAPASLAFDLEAWTTSDTTCDNAIKGFLDGMIQQVQSHGYRVVLYTSGSMWSTITVGTYRLGTLPNIAWLAAGGFYASDYNSNATVWGNAYLGDGYYTPDKRHYQYNGSHMSYPYGGLSLSIDNDCGDSLMDGVARGDNADSGTESASSDPSEDAHCNSSY